MAAEGTATPTRVQGALLVGSVPYETEDEVMRAVAASLGDRLRRIPDGEVEDRRSWAEFLPTVFALDRENLYIRTPATREKGPTPFSIAWFNLRPGKSATDVEFPTLRYADWAKRSYETFVRLREEGVVRSGVRFQVNVPGLAPVAAYFERSIQADIERAYLRAMFNEIDQILEAVPHDDLSIQWDLPFETFVWDRQIPPEAMPVYWSGDREQGVLERLNTLAGAVPEDVDLGMHLCYGDRGGEHAIEPQDAGAVAELMTRGTEAIDRAVTYWHFPVPIDRDDDAFYEPLEGLRIDDDSELYVGLVHLDGAEGAQRRIEAAARHLDRSFGVATECGIGRRQPDEVAPLLETHREVSAPVAG